jgi:predicted anti-sigma-YlaC factor YlaD
MKSRPFIFAISLGLLPLAASCSINRLAINAVSNALTGSGSSEVFTGDSDLELVGDALPFAIKLYESLLAQNPDHQGLILTTGSLFVMYANAFVQAPAEMLPIEQVDDRYAANARAKKLYLRGADIILSGLEKKYPGWKDAAENETLDRYLGETKKEDVPSLYWAVAGLISAYSMDVFDFELGMRLPELTAMIKRAYELDPDFNKGALDDFFILFYSSVPEGLGGDPSLVEPHFQRAVEKSGGLSAGPYVSYAEAVCKPAQDYKSFKEYLEKALAVDADADPANRLVNILAQKKARYLLDTASDFFLVSSEDE